MQQETMPLTSPSLDLETRASLPDPLRKLFEDYPRDLWESHSNFDGLVRFWLERHIMFRRLVVTLQNDIASLEAKNLETNSYKARTARFGNLFVSDLHMHHNIEDHQYFPLLQKMDASLARGFEILDADHHRIDDYLKTFTDDANRVLKADNDTIATEALQFQENIERLEHVLERHLNDEEELVVPVVLKYGFDH